MRRTAAAVVFLSSFLVLCASAGAQQAPANAPDSSFGAGVAHVGDKGVTPPKALKEVRPQYTPAAKDAKIQGNVSLHAIVKADGTIGDVRVVKSLDSVHGLDDQAIAAAKQWRFKPGRKNGKPVPVLVTLDFTFTLQ